MEIFNAYIVPVTLVACLCVGYILKNFIPTDKVNKYIPLIVGVFVIFTTAWNAGWTITPEILVIGLVSGLSSASMYKLFKQFIKK